MQWWVWVIVVLVVLAVLTGAFLAMQSRRRRGGVIVDATGAKGRTSGRRGGGA
jgi:hypothetical protein